MSKSVLALAVLLGVGLLVVPGSARELLQQQRNNAARRGLAAPCLVVGSSYPLRTCRVEQSASVCGRGFGAWQTIQDCCAPGRAFPEGCTDFSKNVTCWVAGTYWPTQTCGTSTNITRCSENANNWATQEACCRPGAAFPAGCTKPKPCFYASRFHPFRDCERTEDQAICQRGWGAYDTKDECCAPGKGHSDGCGVVEGFGEE